METPKCPTCKEEMTTGFSLDHTYGTNLQGMWVEGHPENSFWTGLKLKGRKVLPVTTYRCPSCGLLQSYARPEQRD